MEIYKRARGHFIPANVHLPESYETICSGTFMIRNCGRDRRRRSSLGEKQYILSVIHYVCTVETGPRQISKI